MGTAVQVGKETTHGTVASAFVSVPCDFSAKLNQMNKVLDEDRQGQDRNFAMQVGQANEEFEVGESGIYHDTIGYWLMSAIGAPTMTEVEVGAVYDNTFKFADDPKSLSLKWQQPRRYTQAYEALYAVVDEMEFSFAADGDLRYTASGVAMAETETTQITHAFSTVVPMPVWCGSVILAGGAYTRLVSGSVKIARNRSPFFTIRNQKSPNSMNIGARTIEFELVLDFSSKAEYDDFKGGTNDALTVTWSDTDVTIGASANPEFEIKLGTIAYEEAEIDTGTDLPQIKMTGKALYNNADASLAVFRVQSTIDYTA